MRILGSKNIEKAKYLNVANKICNDGIVILF